MSTSAERKALFQRHIALAIQEQASIPAQPRSQDAEQQERQSQKAAEREARFQRHLALIAEKQESRPPRAQPKNAEQQQSQQHTAFEWRTHKLDEKSSNPVIDEGFLKRNDMFRKWFEDQMRYPQVGLWMLRILIRGEREGRDG